MRLTRPELMELQDALDETAGQYSELAALATKGRRRRLQDIAPPGPIPEVIFAVIMDAERNYWVHDLVAAARASNPKNVRLLKLAAAIGLEPGGLPLDETAAGDALAKVADHFERMIDPQRGIADLGSFAVKIQELLRRVCAVELANESGSGFLIGPETVLTNYHVVEKAIAASFDPANVRLRFDYRRLRDGMTTNAGVTYELADDWLVDSARYSPADEKPYDASSLPAEDELDYAVLRTRDKIGLAAASGPGDSARGWIDPRMQAYDFPSNSFLMVVQHPCHDPIAFDDVHDAVVRVNPNGTRVHYRTNTMPGSSGSPVLNRQLDLVALHHAGEPGSPDFGLPCHKQVTAASYNEGIPIAKIQTQLETRGHAWVFGSEAA